MPGSSGSVDAASGRVVLSSGEARLTVSPADGGRMASLVVAGHELLVTEGFGPIAWGCYPMAPFAGRIRDGRFRFRGRPVQLPLNLPPHSIHGTVFERPWRLVGATRSAVRLAIDLGPGWPFRGRVEQRLELSADGLEATMTLEVDEPMPAWIGWHPWFRRRLTGTEVAPLPPSGEVELVVPAASMYVRGPDGLPTGEVGPPSPPPWDDCFTDLAGPPVVRWPGALELELRSSAVCWVVYDGSPDGVCVEPQTAPPDAVNLEAAASTAPVVEPGRPLEVSMSWRWRPA